jgi:hypothetical protein
MFLTHFERSQWKCCDPLGRHKSAVRGSLRSVSIASATKLKETQITVKPGEKLCPTCRKLLVVEHEESDSIDDVDYISTHEEKIDLNASLTQFGCSPLKVCGVRDRKSYAKRKIQSVQKEVSDKVAKVLNITDTDLLEHPVEHACKNCEDLRIFLRELKEKCKTASRREKIRLLTLVPASWNIEQVATEFNVTQYMVKLSRELYKESGILGDPAKKHGKTLSEETFNAVKLFYEEDEFSRMCPGKKDFVSVKSESGRIHKQKRLLLTNIKEMHIEFKKRTNFKIGLSKFCELRPRWCVTVDNSGMHSVCVCQTHQNLKLLIGVLPSKRLDCNNIFLMMVCALDSRECMLHRCNKCSGRDSLKTHIEALFASDETDG